ncbi:MAG: hypothetical protein IPF87_24905 [Gemmatimonadetes bacterium]|nr:hypothetical protein [Gemmatimonadota bacterium]
MATTRTPPPAVRYSNFLDPRLEGAPRPVQQLPPGVNAEMAMSESVEYAAP